MPSVIISSSEDSESEAFSVEHESDKNKSQDLAGSDSADVFLSEEDEEPAKGKSMEMGIGNEKEPSKSAGKVTVKQEKTQKKRYASDVVDVKEENENGNAKRRSNELFGETEQ